MNDKIKRKEDRRGRSGKGKDAFRKADTKTRLAGKYCDGDCCGKSRTKVLRSTGTKTKQETLKQLSLTNKVCVEVLF